MKLTYKQKLFGLILVIFALFSICILVSERRQERQYKTEALESKLDGYVEILNRYIGKRNLQQKNMLQIDSLINILPSDIRITLIGADGNVLYDKDVADVKTLDNHLDRPEVMKAQYQDFGTNIRVSASVQQEYLYYAKFFNSYFIRVALPYTIETQSLLQPDNLFIYVVLALFLIVLLVVNYVAGRFAKSIAGLKEFAIKIKEDQPLPEKLVFPDDELGEIGRELAGIFKQKEKGKREIEAEREKFIRHFHYSEVGLCMFAPDSKKILANTHFMQYLNVISDKPTFDVEDIFTDKEFRPVVDFLNNRASDNKRTSFQIEKNGKVFSVQVIIFDDKSFEITIKDITKTEKNRLLKQEMTSNIAHELRTPVASLRGYLETLNDHDLPADKQRQFIDRAYMQVLRLSNLIEDVSLISNIEERPAKFLMEKINLSQLVDEVRIDLSDKIAEKNIRLQTEIDPQLDIEGNYTLLYSIFRNLMDNSISHGGKGIDIHISCYMQDAKYVYFSYYDTGKGILKEEHLNRLFERFYRVHEGRTRNEGGTGLGLSIVKNAVLLHRGEIQAKNHDGGGLEFLFTLHK